MEKYYKDFLVGYALYAAVLVVTLGPVACYEARKPNLVSAAREFCAVYDREKDFLATPDLGPQARAVCAALKQTESAQHGAGAGGAP